MFNLRATAKLLKRLECSPAGPGETTTRLGDWYGNLFSVGRQQFALFTSERSLLTAVMPATEIHSLPLTLAARVHRLLSELNAPPALIDDEVEQMHQCAVTATGSRSVLGSLNDFTFAAKFYLGQSPPLTLNDLQHRLAGTPLKPLDYLSPREAALDVLCRDGTCP